MRILMISWEYPPYSVGGIGSHVTELSSALRALKCEDVPLAIDLITPRFAGGSPIESIAPSLTVHRVDVPLIERDYYEQIMERNQILVTYANERVQEHRYDVVHVHDWISASVGIALKSQWQIPLVVTLHSTMQGRHQGKLVKNYNAQIDLLEQKVCQIADRVIVCSEFMSQEIQTFFQLSSEKVVVIFNGVHQTSIENFSPGDLSGLRSQYAPDGEKLLFFVGRIVYEKGPQLLVQAMPEILHNHPRTRLLIAGDRGNKLERLAYELNVEKAIDFLGYVSDRQKNSLYRVVDALIIPSLYEPFGMVALEAMASGCNVIASQAGGLQEVVRHKKNGLLVPPNNVNSIVDAVNQLFADPVAAQKRCTLALHEIDTKYQWSVIAAQTRQVYQSTVHA